MLEVIYFGAKWCGPCKIASPVVESLKEELGFELIKLDIDEAPEEASVANIRSVPTLILYKDGKEVERLTGGRPKSTLKDIFNKYL